MRVSTLDQSTDMQRRDLTEYAKNRGFEIVAEFEDLGISGSKSSRPKLDELMKFARKSRIDCVLVWRFDRFARSGAHLTKTLEEFKQRGIEFLSYQENIDTGSPMGQAMFMIIAAMAQLERDIIIERVKAGMATAKAKGKRLGRPRRLDPVQVKQMLSDGMTQHGIARALGVSAAAINRIAKQ